MSASLRRWITAPAVIVSPIQFLSYTTQLRSYAKKIVSKVSTQTTQKSKPEVESNPEKLLKYCCGANIYIEGNDPEIKADSAYPEWLWTLRTERGGPDLSELDPNTSSYWKRLSRITRVRNLRVSKRLKKLKELQFPNDKI